MNPTERSAKTTKTMVALIVALAALCCVPSLAAAEFSRPFIGQLTNSPTGPSGEAVPLSVGGGITTDADGDVYVGNGADVEEFGASGGFVRQLTGLPTASLAFDDMSGKLEVASGSNPYDEWVATDNSPGLTAGDVYFTRSFAGKAAVTRLNWSGTPEKFTCMAEHAAEYVKGNELSGKPGEHWAFETVQGIAVNSGGGESEGDVYVVNNTVGAFQVDQFTSAGCFVRAFTGAMVPEVDAFTQRLYGVAVDPTTSDVLIEDGGNDVIDEFTYGGAYLGKITGVSGKDQFESLYFGQNDIAVSATGKLYVRVGEEYNHSPTPKKTVVDEFGDSAFYPDVVTGEVTGAQAESATLNGTVNGEGRGLAECRFQYVSEAAFGADDVNAVQTVTLAGATGGTFSLASGAQSTGAEGTGDMVGPAEGSGEVFAGVNVVVDPVASKGTFVAGEEIAGGGFPAGTRIEAVEPGFLVLSSNAGTSGTVALSAASDRITAVHTTSGAFAVGEEIVGAGIPEGTTIVEAEGATIALSADVTASGTGVALSSALPYDASAGQVQLALASLHAIGAGDVKVSEVSGSGGGPYTIDFTGALAHSDVAQLDRGRVRADAGRRESDNRGQERGRRWLGARRRSSVRTGGERAEAGRSESAGPGEGRRAVVGDGVSRSSDRRDRRGRKGRRQGWRSGVVCRSGRAVAGRRVCERGVVVVCDAARRGRSARLGHLLPVRVQRRSGGGRDHGARRSRFGRSWRERGTAGGRPVAGHGVSLLGARLQRCGRSLRGGERVRGRRVLDGAVGSAGAAR